MSKLMGQRFCCSLLKNVLHLKSATQEQLNQGTSAGYIMVFLHLKGRKLADWVIKSLYYICRSKFYEWQHGFRKKHTSTGTS